MKKIKETEVKVSKKKELTKTEKTIEFLDKNRKFIYGAVGGILVTALAATIMWPDRIATLKDGSQIFMRNDMNKSSMGVLYDNLFKSRR